MREKKINIQKYHLVFMYSCYKNSDNREIESMYFLLHMYLGKHIMGCKINAFVANC